MREFKPDLFVGIGETGAFFTLRETYLHRQFIPGEGDLGNAVHNGVYQGTIIEEVRSFHHFNLSQDGDEAFAKAQAAAVALGLPLSTKREDMDAEMREIHRATAEQLQARRDREAQWEADRRQRELARLGQYRDLIDDGRVPFGEHAGVRFDEAPLGYINWLVKTDFRKDADAHDQIADIMQAAKDHITVNFPELCLPDPHPSATAGQVGKRELFEVIVVKHARYYRRSFSGYGEETVHIVTMVRRGDHVCIVSKSTAFAAEPGERFTIRATVKEHSEYNGQMQTVVQRVSIVSVD